MTGSPTALRPFYPVGDSQSWKTFGRSCQPSLLPDACVPAPWFHGGTIPPLSNASSAKEPLSIQGAHPILGKSEGTFFFLNLLSAGLVHLRDGQMCLTIWLLFRGLEDSADGLLGLPRSRLWAPVSPSAAPLRVSFYPVF